MAREQKRMDIAKARNEFDRVVDAVARGDGNVVLERDGVPTAAIVSLDALIRANRHRPPEDPEFEALRAALRVGFAGVSDEEIERETDRAIAEARVVARAEPAVGVR